MGFHKNRNDMKLIWFSIYTREKGEAKKVDFNFFKLKYYSKLRIYGVIYSTTFQQTSINLVRLSYLINNYFTIDIVLIFLLVNK